MRVRFAPSPTGALHIGGLRTALYNYLLARQHGGQFLLRIEDTDQGRYVPGAEEYILEALKWAGINPDEGVGFGGEYGPYRQSDRKAIYAEQVQHLIDRGAAYYAFDTPETLEKRRAAEANFTYNHATRDGMENSLTLSAWEVEQRLKAEAPYVIRLKIMPNRTIMVRDLIRGEVPFQSSELDDKVLMKADGMPTYHLANIVDDHLMRITHVIRGEEWLPSTAHHVLLYEGFGWEDTMPQFAHLPLILKPEGNGKLSKRDGAKFGIPVFPLGWDGDTVETRLTGFRETGFLPAATINFLALLGWHPGGDQEIYSLAELIQQFSIENISKSGARFDYEKAKWFNQQYIRAMDNHHLADLIKPLVQAKGYSVSDDFLEQAVGLMKERVTFLPDFVEQGYYLFEPIREYDAETMQKKWNPAFGPVFSELATFVENFEPFEREALEAAVKQFATDHGVKPGDLLPLLRLAMAGTMKGPAIFDMAVAIGRAETVARIRRFANYAHL
jgi:glutamyl-tRNA synthetase